MSQENVELTHRFLDAFNRHHLAAVLALMDDDVESDSLIVAIEGGYHGHDGVRRLWEDAHNAVPDLTIEAVEVRDLGDLTVANAHLRGPGAGPGYIGGRIWEGDVRDRCRPTREHEKWPESTSRLRRRVALGVAVVESFGRADYLALLDLSRPTISVYQVEARTDGEPDAVGLERRRSIWRRFLLRG